MKIKLLFLLSILCLTTKVDAYDVKIKGLYYNLNDSDMTAEVTYNAADKYDRREINIPSEVSNYSKVYSVTSIGVSAFENCSMLTSVTIPNSVTSIGVRAFKKCGMLTSVTIPNSVTRIGDSAFENCGMLISVTIPNSVTIIDNSAFMGCRRLTSVTIPNSVTKIGTYCFFGCTGLTSITIPNTVANIEDFTFGGCTSLSAITIPEGVITIGESAFKECSGLQSITIPSSVTSIGKTAFGGCIGITELTINDSKTELSLGNNTNIKTDIDFIDCPIEKLYIGRNLSRSFFYNVFNNKESLINLTIGGYADRIEDEMFYKCSNLTNVMIGNSIMSIGRNAFNSCESLTDITIGNSVKSIGKRSFYGCKSLTTIDIPNSVTNIEDSLFYGCTKLVSVIIPNTVTRIGRSAFEYCSSLCSITLPNLSIINQYTFGSCKSLTSVDIPTSVTRIGNDAFAYCSNLVSVDIPNSVTAIGKSAFEGCRSLSTVSIPKSMTSISAYTFGGCKSLVSVFIPSSMAKVSESAFDGCSNITELKIDDSENELSFVEDNSYDKKPFQDSPIEKLYIGRNLNERIFLNKESLVNVTIGGSANEIGYNMFYDFSNLTNAIIGNSVTSIGDNAFWGCKNLTSIAIPNSVTSIGASAFYDCSGIASINMGDGVKNIGESAFKGCKSLTLITIPNSVTSIKPSVFEGCSGLTSITIPNSVINIGSSAFSGCTNLVSVGIPNKVKIIDGLAFAYCDKLASVVIPSSVTSIGENAFRRCSLIIYLYGAPDIPNSLGLKDGSTIYARYSQVAKIKKTAYSGTVIPIEPYYIEVDGYMYALSAKLKKNEQSPITMDEPTIYAKYNGKQIGLTKDDEGNYTASGLTFDTEYAFYYKVNHTYGVWDFVHVAKTNRCDVDLRSTGRTQTSISFIVDASKADKSCTRGDIGVIYNNKEYRCDGNKVTVTGLKSNTEHKFYAYAYYNDSRVTNEKYCIYKTLGFNTSVKTTVTPTVIQCEGVYDMGTAQLESEELTVKINGVEQTGNPLTVTGLEPKKYYTITYTVCAEDGGEEVYTKEVKTPELELTTLQPKCVSNTCAIVAALTNISEEETNVGFQWKRFDAPESLKPSEGYAAIYGGQIEGYIKNLQATSYYNVRAFYKSSDEQYYYGEWVTFDPSDFSYFEPTVHTYDVTDITESTAKVKGYVLAGTDNITEQGFEYCLKETSGSKAQTMCVPAAAEQTDNVFTVLATGQIMRAELRNLKPETTYVCRAFVRTANGTVYGEEQTFTTEVDMTGIADVHTGVALSTVESYYDMSGRKIDVPKHGINIIRYTDGTTRKVFVK